MKIAEIKRLAENHTIEELLKAEELLLDEKEPDFEINGDDDGEKLTHVMAAMWVLEHQEENKVEVKDAVRTYTQKVRNSIS